MRIRMNYYTDPDILHTDPNSDSRKKLKILILSTIFKYKRKFKKCSKVKIKGLILTFCYGLFLHIYHILYRGYSGSGFVSLYTDPTFIIQIRIHGSGSASLLRLQILHHILLGPDAHKKQVSGPWIRTIGDQTVNNLNLPMIECWSE